MCARGTQRKEINNRISKPANNVPPPTSISIAPCLPLPHLLLPQLLVKLQTKWIYSPTIYSDPNPSTETALFSIHHLHLTPLSVIRAMRAINHSVPPSTIHNNNNNNSTRINNDPSPTEEEGLLWLDSCLWVNRLSLILFAKNVLLFWNSFGYPPFTLISNLSRLKNFQTNQFLPLKWHSH